MALLRWQAALLPGVLGCAVPREGLRGVREDLARRVFVLRVEHEGRTHTYPSYQYSLGGF